MHEVYQQLARRRTQTRPDPRRLAFGRQQDVYDDTAKRKALNTSRRAGKTLCVMLWMIATGEKFPGALIPYICLSRPVAKRILWPTIKSIHEELGLGLTFNEAELSAALPNGAKIVLLGADRPSEIAKLRGQKFPAAAVDECQAFKSSVMTELVDDVLEPALMDYDGELWLVGTPGAACVGYFFEVCTGVMPGWSVHRWTVLDNPHIPHAGQWLDGLRQRRGWTEDNPTYRREYLGEWVHDTDALVYKFERERNLITELPDLPTRTDVLGIDYGYVDSTAWVHLCHRAGGTDEQTVYVPRSWKETGLVPSVAAERTKSYQAQHAIQRMVGDAGGLGKGYIEEARHRFGLQIKAAEKREKLAYIELMNDAFLTGRLQLLESENRDLIAELTLLQWDEERKGPDRRFDDHLCDGLLYGWRECSAYFNTAPASGPDPLNVPTRDRWLEAGWLNARQQARKPGWWDR